MSGTYLISMLQGRSTDFVRKEMWRSIVPIRMNFHSMLDNLEDTLNEQIYARQGQFPREMIDIAWMTRLLVNKYGQKHDFNDSKKRVFFGKNTGQQGHELLTLLNQVAQLNYETSPYNTEFDPELMRKFYTYITQNIPDDNLRNLGLIEDKNWFNNQMSPLSRGILDNIWSNIGRISNEGFVNPSEEQKLQAAIKLGLRTMQKIYGLVEEAYVDLFALWDYEGTWVRSEVEALLNADLKFDDVPIWHDTVIPIVSEDYFGQYVNTFRGFLMRHQEFIQDSGKVFNPKYQGTVWTMPESLNMMHHFSEQPKDYNELKGINPAKQVTQSAKKFLFK